MVPDPPTCARGKTGVFRRLLVTVIDPGLKAAFPHILHQQRKGVEKVKPGRLLQGVRGQGPPSMPALQQSSSAMRGEKPVREV